jgi:ABC-2 type transport system ATP-binding protein
MTLAIQTLNLRKAFNGRVAVEDLSLEVRAGEVFGVLGPNGAGKTTTVKMLLGLTYPTSGQATLLGKPLGSLEARRYLGFLPELFRFHDWMTGRELLRFHGQLCGMPASTLQRRIPEVLELVGLLGRENERIKGYSKGMQQRIGLAQALLNHPKVVFLDEPTSALDPIGRREVREIIRHLKADGTTIFLNSHLLSEVELTCDRVAFVDKGRVVRSGALKELLRERLEVELRVGALNPELLSELGRHARVLHHGPDTVLLEAESEDVLPILAQTVVNSGAGLFSLSPRKISLEDLFVKLVSKESS